jgi:peptidoglycan/xylan/chitin deacetylase (PgdA/CDA1 family)
MSRHGLPICILACMMLLHAAPPQPQRSVALTFDDLPVAPTDHPAAATAIIGAILQALDRHHAPAIGFVIGKRVEAVGGGEGTRLLQDWVRRGYDLGNHTYSHTDLNDVSAAQYERDVVADEMYFAPLMAAARHSAHYFRFPYNHTGDTREKHDAVASFLAGRGYTVAPCTIDNEDSVFDRAYLAALAAKDARSAREIQAAYLEYTSAEIDYYASLHKQIFGREIPHVMLLHANRLNADAIDDVLKLFEQKHYRFVPLGIAMADPAYATPDTFVTKFGWMWGYRWAKELGVKVNGNLETEPADWIKQYGEKAGGKAAAVPQ